MGNVWSDRWEGELPSEPNLWRALILPCRNFLRSDRSLTLQTTIRQSLFAAVSARGNLALSICPPTLSRCLHDEAC